jgi:hypothetical protein
VSSANRTGHAAAQTAADAEAQLAESVEVYLEGGPRPADGAEALASTIIDATALPLRVVRQGAISLERLRGVVPGVLDIDGNAPDSADAPEPAAEPAAAEPAAAAGDAAPEPGSA